MMEIPNEPKVPRFGIVYYEPKAQERIIKDSGYWWRDFLK
jgi:beta-glucosidase